MFKYIMLFSSIGFSVLLSLLLNAIKGKSLTIKKNTYNLKNLILQFISVALFFIYIPHLFSHEVITNQIGLQSGLFIGMRK